MKTSTLVTIAISLILISFSIFFGVKWINTSIELKNIKSSFRAQQTNTDVIAFLKLFVDNVLMSPEPVSFEERLKIENAVRAIKDQKILDQWQKFVNSKSADEVQKEAKTLLQLLIAKMGN